MPVIDGVSYAAILSEDTLGRGGQPRYRYLLTRRWDDSEPRVLFVMLNPSTADALKDDPTIRRCTSFARREGAGGVEVVNLFAYRATDPRELELRDAQGIDVVGPDNDIHIREAMGRAHLVIAAWGASKKAIERETPIKELLMRVRRDYPVTWSSLMALGITKDGAPRHPLYVKGDASLVVLMR